MTWGRTMTIRIVRRILWTLSALGILVAAPAPAGQETPGLPDTAVISFADLNRQLRAGDVVFIHVTPLPFEKVSEATKSWINHVGVVIDVSGSEAIVAESTFPFSRTTPVSKFVARSEHGRVAVGRLTTPPNDEQAKAISVASRSRMGIFYDTGFNLHSRRQYCSRFVREVLREATGVELGDVESFGTLLASNPDTDLGFWRLWFFGRIPWARKTVTPASLYRSEQLNPVFDGRIG